jgi:phosphoglycerol transferase MdoB-like AlkP superfamily enzyme
MDSKECQRLCADVFTTESTDSDTLLTTTRPNIVVILLESCGEEFASAMPYLQQLKQEGICFANCYGNTWRTDRGTVCALSGYPSFPSFSVMKMPQKSGTLPSIARTLQQEGYQTTYLYGGDINFTNMRSYLVATGWERLISMDDFSVSERASARWGVRDDITFEKLKEDILANAKRQSQAQEGGERMLWGYSTLSSHEPWDVPTQTLKDKELNAFAYLDTCLKNFIESLKQTPAWDNLLIVMLADHGINYRDIDQTRPLEKNHIPLVWVGGAVKEPRRIDKLCNQTDLAATLLGQLRLPHEEFHFSRDVLSSTYVHPTAVHNYNNAQLLIDSTGHILYDFDARQLTISQSTDAERLLLLNNAILQVTTEDLSSLRPK